MTEVLPPPAAADPLEQARLRIEAAPFETLTLTELAKAAGLSTYHFVRQFSARFGVSPIAHLRLRRLAAAARELSGTAAPSLIDLAFDCGFASQDSFTRAFKRAYGMPPGRFRQAGGPLTCKETFVMTDPDGVRAELVQSPQPVRGAPLRIAGLSKLFGAADKAGIPALWDRFAPRLPLNGQAGGRTYGVCMASGQAGGMRYMAGAALQPGAAAPEGLEVVDLTAQSYLVFRQTLQAGALHPQMQAAAKAIWGERLPASSYKLAQAPDLEVYPEDFEPGQPGWVEWWIPVEA